MQRRRRFPALDVASLPFYHGARILELGDTSSPPPPPPDPEPEPEPEPEPIVTVTSSWVNSIKTNATNSYIALFMNGPQIDPIIFNNIVAGQLVTISGFTNAGNNGTFAITAKAQGAAQTISMVNPNAVSESYGASVTITITPPPA